MDFVTFGQNKTLLPRILSLYAKLNRLLTVSCLYVEGTYMVILIFLFKSRQESK